MNSIWVVRGKEGYCYDQEEWNVAAYTERETAVEHARLANEAVEEVEEANVHTSRFHNPFDPCRSIYTAKYSVFEISPVLRHVDEFL